MSEVFFLKETMFVPGNNIKFNTKSWWGKMVHLGAIWNLTLNILTLQVSFLRYNKISITAIDINMFIIR